MVLNLKLSRLYSVFVFAVTLALSQFSLAQKSQIRPEAEVIMSAEVSKDLDKLIPKNFLRLLVDETYRNPYFYGDESRLIESSVTRGERIADVGSLVRLGDFDPRKGLWFYLPYFEIPVGDFEHINVSKSISPEMRRLYFFTRDGVEYLRYFLHPFRELQNYVSLTRKYTLKYDYLARPISSPRSMVVIQENHPESPYWVKVSLGLTMSALQRRQKPEKLARALMVNEALELIPMEEREEMHLDWMNESFAAQLPGKEEVIIGRDVRTIDETEGSSKRLIPTFSFFHSPDGSTEPEVTKLIARSGLSEIEFFKKYFLKPAISTFIRLAFEEGIQWSMHTGNYYTEVNSRGLPTGKLIIKDFDGAAFDPEMRMLMGKPFHGIHGMTENPFSDAWFSAATGRGTKERQRIGYVFDLYIRDVYGFNSIGSYMFSYLQTWGSMNKKTRQQVREVVEAAIDEVTIDEIKTITGIEVTSKMLDRGQGEDAGINIAYNLWRDMNQETITRDQAPEKHQAALRNEFIRLMKINRVWADFSKSNVTAARKTLNGEGVVFFYHEHAGMIQVRRYAKDQTFKIIGYAMIEDPSQSTVQSDFLKSIDARRPAKKALKSCESLLVWLEIQFPVYRFEQELDGALAA